MNERQGLRVRFPTHLQLRNYSAKELARMAPLMAESHATLGVFQVQVPQKLVTELEAFLDEHHSVSCLAWLLGCLAV